MRSLKDQKTSSSQKKEGPQNDTIGTVQWFTGQLVAPQTIADTRTGCHSWYWGQNCVWLVIGRMKSPLCLRYSYPLSFPYPLSLFYPWIFVTPAQDLESRGEPSQPAKPYVIWLHSGCCEFSLLQWKVDSVSHWESNLGEFSEHWKRILMLTSQKMLSNQKNSSVDPFGCLSYTSIFFFIFILKKYIMHVSFLLEKNH